MSMLQEIGQFLQNAAIGLTRGLNLFEGYLDDDPSIAVGLFEVPGEAPVRVFVAGVAGIAYERPYLQVQCRDVTYAAARSRAHQIEGLLEGIGNQKLPDASGTMYGSILSKQPPFELQRLPGELINLTTVAQIFAVQKKRSAA